MNIRYLLDTNAASYAINKKSPAVDRHLARVPMGDLAISAVTEGELHYGAARRPSMPLQSIIERFLLGVTVIPWDSVAARQYGRLRATLERDPDDPRWIKTVHGVGYKLDLHKLEKETKL